jgi:hypothetical protein
MANDKRINMKAQEFKKELLNDFSEILSQSKLEYLSSSIDTIINQTKLDILNEWYAVKKPIEIDTHGGNDYPRL